MHNSTIDEKNRPLDATRWDPLQVALPGMSRARARRVLSVARPTYAESITGPYRLATEGHAEPASAGDVQVAEIWDLIAKTNARREGAAPRTDFNSQLLWMTLDSKARVSLGAVLQRLVAAGLLVRRSPEEYSVSAAGVAAMQRVPVRIAKG